LLMYIDALIKVYKANNSNDFYERAIKYIEIAKKIIEKDIKKPLSFLLLPKHFAKLADMGYTYQLNYELTGNVDSMALAKSFYNKALEITKFKRFSSHTPILAEKIEQLDNYPREQRYPLPFSL